MARKVSWAKAAANDAMALPGRCSAEPGHKEHASRRLRKPALIFPGELPYLAAHHLEVHREDDGTAGTPLRLLETHERERRRVREPLLTAVRADTMVSALGSSGKAALAAGGWLCET